LYNTRKRLQGFCYLKQRGSNFRRFCGVASLR